MKFLLDTNFVMIPAMFGVDIYGQLREFENAEFYTLDLVCDELAKLSKKHNKNATTALTALKKEGVVIIACPHGTSTDKALLDMAEKRFVVCTQDRALIKKLKHKKCRVVTMRQKKYVREV